MVKEWDSPATKIHLNQVSSLVMMEAWHGSRDDGLNLSVRLLIQHFGSE